MGVLSLKVRIVDRGVVKTMQFDPATLVYDACTIIREKIPDACAQGQGECRLDVSRCVIFAASACLSVHVDSWCAVL
jgi:hypothetical protein